MRSIDSHNSPDARFVIVGTPGWTRAETAPDQQNRYDIPEYRDLINQGWTDDSACRDNPELFFSIKEEEIAEAAAICKRCPVKSRCDDLARATETRFGVWGGENRAERVRSTTRRMSSLAINKMLDSEFAS